RSPAATRSQRERHRSRCAPSGCRRGTPGRGRPCGEGPAPCRCARSSAAEADLLREAVTGLQLDDLVFAERALGVVSEVDLEDRLVAGKAAKLAELRDSDRGLVPGLDGALDVHLVLRALRDCVGGGHLTSFLHRAVRLRLGAPKPSTIVYVSN